MQVFIAAFFIIIKHGSHPDALRMWGDCCCMPVALLPKAIPWSNYEKDIRQPPTEGQSAEQLTSPPNCQGHQEQGKPEKLPQPRGAKGNVKRYLGRGPGTEKGHEVNTEDALRSMDLS